MRKVKVMYVSSVICEAEIVVPDEADEYDIREISDAMDGGEFTENPCTGDWRYFGMMELGKAK